MRGIKERYRSVKSGTVLALIVMGISFLWTLMMISMIDEGRGVDEHHMQTHYIASAALAQSSVRQTTGNLIKSSTEAAETLENRKQASTIEQEEGHQPSPPAQQQQTRTQHKAAFESLPESPLIIKQTGNKTKIAAEWSPPMTDQQQQHRITLEDWPKLVDRLDIVTCIQKLGGTTGVEIGVQRGRLAWRSLQIWTNCKAYKLVDLWGKEANYVEPGPFSNERKNQHLLATRKILRPYKSKTQFFVMRSSDAAAKFENDYFDYIYVDARHDYCAVLEDMEHYWPKLKAGGIMAGHDFVDAAFAMSTLGPHEDWSKCEDGTVNVGAVKGAVLDFAVKHGNLRLLVTTEQFPSWVLQKPYE